MLRIDQMKNDVQRLQSECAHLQAQAGLLGAWQSLKTMAIWETISKNLSVIEDHATETCIANGTSETEWRESAAEARVYRWLRKRPESVERDLEQIASELKIREAEIKQKSSITKGV